MKYKYLLNLWRGKDIPEVLEEFDKLVIDKLVFKYMQYPLPHQALNILVEGKVLDEYDYIIFVTSDLVFKQENIDQLINDIETTDAKMMGAICNVDMAENKNKVCACRKRVESHQYEWLEDTETGIQQVMFNGFVLLAVHKSMFEGFRFFEGEQDFPIDLRLCENAIERGVPIMTNFDNKTLHLRFQGRLMTGQPSEILFNGKSIKLTESKKQISIPLPIEYN